MKGKCKMKIILYVHGGTIQDINRDAEAENVEVEIKDFDIDGYCEDQLQNDNDGNGEYFLLKL